MINLVEARQMFRNEGLTVREWAESHGFSPSTVYAVLGGRVRGDRGESHRVCLALGLKERIKSPKLQIKPEIEKVEKIENL